MGRGIRWIMVCWGHHTYLYDDKATVGLQGVPEASWEQSLNVRMN